MVIIVVISLEDYTKSGRKKREEEREREREREIKSEEFYPFSLLMTSLFQFHQS